MSRPGPTLPHRLLAGALMLLLTALALRLAVEVLLSILTPLLVLAGSGGALALFIRYRRYRDQW
jgi:hypothetical protein